jgi:hypothetical protein
MIRTARVSWTFARMGVLSCGLGLAVYGTASAQPATDIYLLELAMRDGRIEAVGTPTAAVSRDGYDNQPAFLPDASGFLYTSIRDGQADIYRYDVATGSSAQVTRTPESEYSPTPIPGSDRFAAVRVEADSTQRLWSFAPDGSDARLILERIAPVGYHAWASPDHVALFILGEPPTLQVARVDAGTAATVAGGIGRSIQPVPHRPAVTFTQVTDEEWWIRELDLESGADRAVARLPAPDGYHAWTPDGALLTAHGRRIYQLDDDGAWRLVADLTPYDVGDLSRLAVSPDGTLLAVVADRS